MNVSAHLRGIVIAGGLAALALALAFITLVMNQSASHAPAHTVLPLKDRAHGSSAGAGKPAPVKRVDANLQAALKAGLPRSVAKALAAAPVAVVELTSSSDPVAAIALGEAKAGAALGGASFVSVSVDENGGDVQTLTRLLGHVPTAPAALVYVRPASLYVTLPGFNDRTTVQQAAANALPTAAGSTAVAAPPTWATQAGVLCTQAATQIDALGGMRSPAKLAAQKVRFEAVATGFLLQMKGLHAPAGKSVVVSQLNALLVKNFAAADAEVAATSLKSGAALSAANARAATLRPRLDKLERKLGAGGCTVLTA